MYSRHLEGQTAYELFSRGVRFLEGGHPHQAAMVLSLAKLIEPEKPSVRVALGRALFMTGQIARARREFAKVVQINPSDDWAHFALALACERTGQRARALGHLKLAMAMRPGESQYEHALHRMGGP
ncbi:MAG TPA: tetratricopeptide repeat protein [Actinomycetota bacterium]